MFGEEAYCLKKNGKKYNEIYYEANSEKLKKKKKNETTMISRMFRDG